MIVLNNHRSTYLPSCKLGILDKESSFFAKYFIPVFIFFIGYVAVSPFFFNFGWRGIHYLTLMSVFYAFFLLVEDLKIKKWFLFLTLSVVITSCISAIYWADPRYVLSSVFFIFSALLIQYVNNKVLNKLITFASFFMLAIMILAVAGFFIAYSGIQPLFSFPNPDGRPNFFFYTTLTNSFSGNFIRPSGIYDEPGALILFICSIAALRHLLSKDNRLTWMILVLGFITFSLAHLIYVFFHLLAEKLSLQNLVRLVSIILIGAIVFIISGAHGFIGDKVFSRFTISESGSFEGDNRSFRFFNAIDHMSKNPKSILFGADPICRFEYDVCKQKFPPMGENPLSPLVFQGIFVAWPYYLFVTLLLISPCFGKRYFVAFGMGLLFIQRPSILGLGSSMIALLTIYITYSSCYMKKFRSTSLSFLKYDRA
jgi:hypothetical protein